MRAPDGSMTFDWIFFAIVAIPWFYALWELRKSYRSQPKARLFADERRTRQKL